MIETALPRRDLLSRLKAFKQRSSGVVDRAWSWTLSSAPVLSTLQAPHRLVMPILFVGAICIGIAILPGDIERIAALERDGNTARALELLEARFQRGDRSSTTLFQLQRLYDHYGDTEKGRSALELLAKNRPRDAAVQRQLAQLYKATQDEPAYINALRTQLALRYSEPACRELIGLLRRNNDYDAETALLRRCRAAGYRRPDDLVRLAYLEAVEGRIAETAQLLMTVDDTPRRRLAVGRDRLLLFTSLLETSRPDEAVRRAVRWLRGQPDVDVAVDFANRLVEAGRTDLAISFASSVGQPGDAMTMTVAEVMVGLGQAAAARSYLGGWLQQNRGMDLELATRFVLTGLDVEDPALALAGAERFGLDKLDATDLVALAEGLLAYGGSIDTLQPLLTRDLLARNALLAAGVELRSGRLDAARSLLLQMRIDDLDDRRADYFARLVEQAGRTPALAAVLREPRFAAIAAGPGRAQLVGPAQLQAKQRIQKRADANKKVRDKRRAKATPDATPIFTPFPFPGQQ